jgi:hypothetical protein
MKKISVDHPGHIDKLGRTAFARHLLSLVECIDAETGGAVIGLEGVWGSGKTRVLQSLEGILAESDASTRPIRIAFNPWMISGTLGLVEALLLQIAAGLPENSPSLEPRSKWPWQRRNEIAGAASLAGSIISYAGILSTVKHFGDAANWLLPGSGVIVTGIGVAASAAADSMQKLQGPLEKLAKRPSALSLSDARKEVEVALAGLGRRVLVVIDDLDRLPPLELAAMVQAIKVVADFPNVVYVVAYDPDVAADAIQIALRVSNGRAFMEKIIQVPLPLPNPPASKFHRFALERLKSTVEESELSKEELEDLHLAWPLSASLLKTPRDVERLRTRLLVAFSMLTGKVNAADLAMLECLTLHAPKIIEWIILNPTVVIQPGLLKFDDALNARGALGDPYRTIWQDAGEREKAAKEKVGEWLRLVPEQSAFTVPIRGMMNLLFDRTRDWSRSQKRSGKLRVQDYRFWYRWLCYHDQHERWDAARIVDLLDKPSEIEDAGILDDRDTFFEFCQEICDLGVDNIGHPSATAVSAVFSMAEDKLSYATNIPNAFGYDPIRALLLIIRSDSAPNRVQALNNLIDDASVWLSGYLIHFANADITGKSEANEEQWLAPNRAALDTLMARWFNRVLSSFGFRDGFQHTAKSGYCPNNLVHWMLNFGASPQILRVAVDGFIGHSPENFALYFSGEVDSPRQEHLGISVNWEVLPVAYRLQALCQGKSGFNQTHSRLIKVIDERVVRLDAAASLATILQTLAIAKSKNQ